MKNVTLHHPETNQETDVQVEDLPLGWFVLNAEADFMVGPFWTEGEAAACLAVDPSPFEMIVRRKSVIFA